MEVPEITAPSDQANDPADVPAQTKGSGPLHP
jgi:hypothetical protein